MCFRNGYVSHVSVVYLLDFVCVLFVMVDCVCVCVMFMSGCFVMCAWVFGVCFMLVLLLC